MGRPCKQIPLDFQTIDSALDSGERVSLKTLAETHGTCPPVIRRILRSHYGDSIQFKAGRNGGVVRVPVSSNTTETVATVA